MYSKDERETVCVYEEATDSWVIESSVRRHITKLTKIFGEDSFDKCETDSEGRYIYVSIPHADPSQVSFRNKSKPMSDERKKEVAERLQKAREKNS